MDYDTYIDEELCIDTLYGDATYRVIDDTADVDYMIESIRDSNIKVFSE